MGRVFYQYKAITVTDLVDEVNLEEWERTKPI